MGVNDKEFDRKVESSIERILAFSIKNILDNYEEKIFDSLAKKQYEKAEEQLSELCFQVLDMSENDQVFFLRVYFTSMITEIIRNHSRKDRLHSHVLAFSYAMIETIESWNNVTEFLLAIPWFIRNIATKLVSGTVLFEGNPHVTKALQLINDHLEDDYLTVHWLADQLNISTTHLSNLFKFEVGETITKYITDRKIEEITFELKYTNKSLHEIRKKYGFNNHSHFIQYFKKVKGKTPLKYKQDLINR